MNTEIIKTNDMKQENIQNNKNITHSSFCKRLKFPKERPI